MKTLIIDGDTNVILEVREPKNYLVNQNTFDRLKEEFGKEVVFASKNGVYGKEYTVFILESK